MSGFFFPIFIYNLFLCQAIECLTQKNESVTLTNGTIKTLKQIILAEIIVIAEEISFSNVLPVFPINIGLTYCIKIKNNKGDKEAFSYQKIVQKHVEWCVTVVFI